uniref:Uncharacterized protein n=1 Tax=Steinernema glaseri TaxID=37863 RepID=A0A1I7ZZM7_9BILA
MRSMMSGGLRWTDSSCGKGEDRVEPQSHMASSCGDRPLRRRDRRRRSLLGDLPSSPGGGTARRRFCARSRRRSRRRDNKQHCRQRDLLPGGVRVLETRGGSRIGLRDPDGLLRRFR